MVSHKYDAFRKCNKYIDPLREVLFKIIVADAVAPDWDRTREFLKEAKEWLERAEQSGLPFNETHLVWRRLEVLFPSIGDEDKWFDETEWIVPDIIHIVFSLFLRCYLRKIGVG